MTDGNDQEKQTILIVDDTPENLAMVSSMLSDRYKIKIATTGKKALQIAYSQDPPDLILLDIMMPEMDGYEVCRQLKNDSQVADIPVIFLTAKSDVEDEMKGFELGAVDYITKPVSPPIVLARVRTHLQLKRVNDYLNNKLDQNDLR